MNDEDDPTTFDERYRIETNDEDEFKCTLVVEHYVDEQWAEFERVPLRMPKLPQLAQQCLDAYEEGLNQSLESIEEAERIAAERQLGDAE